MYISFKQRIRNYLYKIKYFFSGFYIIPRNYILAKRYPWIITTEDLSWNEGKYRNTIMDDIPSGWRKAFGLQLIADIDQYLKKHNIKDYVVYQVKEKWGELRWYDNCCSAEMYKDIIHKYEVKSRDLCIHCGKASTRFTKGWITPVCDKCTKKYKLNTTLKGAKSETNDSRTIGANNQPA
jgi:hypothetical protein